MYRKVIKPPFDFVTALLFITALSPFFIIIPLALFFTNKGKVFFTQKRIGYHEKTYTLVKFKTLRDTYDKNGKQLPDLERQFAFGTLIRQAHLDEMPQLFDILLGKSSFVGPRPLLPEYLPYYTQYQRKRHLVKPGITGLSQIKGANSLEWDERLRFDSVYAENCTFKMDFIIILKTFGYIFFKPKNRIKKKPFSDSFIDYCKKTDFTKDGQDYNLLPIHNDQP